MNLVEVPDARVALVLDKSMDNNCKAAAPDVVGEHDRLRA